MPVDPAHTSSLEGRLGDFPLPDILQMVQVSGKSGGLFIRRSNGKKAVVAFRNGQIVQALSAESYQTLGNRLVESGAITPAGLQEALGYSARFPGMRVGDALVELGVVTRTQVEGEVKAQMTQTIQRLMGWSDAEFEFRPGLTSLGRGMPDFAVDLVLEKGVEARQILLEASIQQDKDDRDNPGAADGDEWSETSPPLAADSSHEGQAVIRWFDEGARLSRPDPGDPELALASKLYLGLSEELFYARGLEEVALLLLRYASELYASGGLVQKQEAGFRILGQFGEAFRWEDSHSQVAQAAFAPGDSPLFDVIVEEKTPYSGFAHPGGGSPRRPGANPWCRRGSGDSPRRARQCLADSLLPHRAGRRARRPRAHCPGTPGLGHPGEHQAPELRQAPRPADALK